MSRSFSSSLHTGRRQQLDPSAKIVKLKQQPSDLKFVFSVKLKDEPSVTVKEEPAPAGRSLLKKNAAKDFVASFASSLREPQQPASSVSKMGRIVNHDTLGRRPLTKKHRSSLAPYHHFKSGGGGEYETACAVSSLIQADTAAAGVHSSSSLGKFVPDFKNRKVQIDREIHNSMERQRRIELKNEFESLKSLIPELAHNEKVSKLNLLNVAAKYVVRLETSQSRLRWRKELLKEKKKQLLERLNFLHIASA